MDETATRLQETTPGGPPPLPSLPWADAVSVFGASLLLTAVYWLVSPDLDTPFLAWVGVWLVTACCYAAAAIYRKATGSDTSRAEALIAYAGQIQTYTAPVLFAAVWGEIYDAPIVPQVAMSFMLPVFMIGWLSLLRRQSRLRRDIAEAQRRYLAALTLTVPLEEQRLERHDHAPGV